jgi:TetR/AcrR family transcriptional regulator, mexCD-oprJ operon repressor
VLALLQPLIERGQRAGTFRSDVPAQWHLSMLLALAHAATSELRAKHIAAAQIEPALVTTILGALGADVRGSRRLSRQKMRRET